MTSILVTRKRDYAKELEGKLVKWTPTTQHPLYYEESEPEAEEEEVEEEEVDEKGDETASETKTGTSSPPKAPTKPMLLDPLSLLAATAERSAPAPHGSDDSESDGSSVSSEDSEYEKMQVNQDNLEDLWAERKDSIRDSFGKGGLEFLINRSYVTGDQSSPQALPMIAGKDNIYQVSSRIVDKMSMSLDECNKIVVRLHEDMKLAWAEGRKVGALKNVIASTKFLCSTPSPEAFPMLLVSVSELLDDFGDTVYQRLLDSAQNRGTVKTTLKSDFTCADIPESTKEKTRNWMYKVSCIRELVPRILVEVCFLRLRRFTEPTATLDPIIIRLSQQIRGIGNPIIANYVRCYLARVAIKLIPESKAFLYNMIEDFVKQFEELKSDKGNYFLEKNGISYTQYIMCLSPAVGWVFQRFGLLADKAEFQNILKMYKDKCGNSMVLDQIIQFFTPGFFTPFTTAVIQLIRDSDPVQVPHTTIIRHLGQALIVDPPPDDQLERILNDAWKIVTVTTDLHEYLRCCIVFVELMFYYYTEDEITILLADLGTHIHGLDLDEESLSLIEKLLDVFVNECGDFHPFLANEHWFTLVNLFKGQRKVEISRRLLMAFNATKDVVEDPVMINTLFGFACNLHASLDSLSFTDEKKQVSQVICAFFDGVDCGKDVERQLNFYVECRASFPDLDLVKIRLTTCVLTFTMKILNMVHGKHTKNTSIFVKSCLAYCYITIPSIDDIFNQLHLHVLAGQTALKHGSLPQADAFFKSAISTLTEVEQYYEKDGKKISTESMVLMYVRSLTSALVTLPGHPEDGAFYMVHGVLAALDKYPWNPSSGMKLQALISILSLLGALSQNPLLYRCGAEGNDTMYGDDSEYSNELNELLHSTFKAALQEYNSLAEAGATPLVQSQVLLEFANTLIVTCELTKGSAKKIIQILELAKDQIPDSPFLKSTLAWMRTKSSENKLYSQISDHIEQLVPSRR